MEDIWYQKQVWQLCIAIVVVIVTNAFGFWKIFAQGKNSFKYQVKTQRIEFISQQLTEFYNPLYTLLNVNSNVFELMGPNSFPDDMYKRQAASDLWDKVKENVIMPNNKLLESTLKDKSHFISSEDDIEEYLPLMNHLVMYEIFNEYPTELYANFRFPEGIIGNVVRHRTKLQTELESLK